MKRDDDKNCATTEEQGAETMIAPGIRVVRGPDWIWQNQGKKRDENRNEFELRSGRVDTVESLVNIYNHFRPRTSLFSDCRAVA